MSLYRWCKKYQQRDIQQYRQVMHACRRLHMHAIGMHAFVGLAAHGLEIPKINYHAFLVDKPRTQLDPLTRSFCDVVPSQSDPLNRGDEFWV